MGKLYVANYKDVLSPKVHQVCMIVQENEDTYALELRFTKPKRYMSFSNAVAIHPLMKLYIYIKMGIFLVCPTSLVRI
jgi:hypothetical protein